ncbi:hypothetical protein GCK72_000010 [Caenorhabditis remanei]|uniref:RNA-directed RNA polymerase n=1 Tax=Caenorhabditis remanei TaxID=31234 RepID=A0A6A5HJZ4_CAERE|nr:hypothetical protein GCK72_000010 [Caenorhabditis remanei]KAF1768198.1 hypothetical protein GCK72_000010 [Caenorhabditis remanei]
MSVSQLRHGYLKFEFPESMKTQKDMEEIIETIIEQFEPSLEDSNIRILKRHPTQIVEEQDCDCFFEVNFEVVSEQFDFKLIDAMNEFMKKLTPVAAYKRPTIVAHSSDFWISDLRLSAKDIPLNAIHFGNIQGNRFLNHYEVSFWNETKRFKNGPAGDPLYKIFANFEFDKNDILMVQFQCTQMEEDRTTSGSDSSDKENKNKCNKNENKNQKKKIERTVNYQVTVRRDSIRRIIVDPYAKDDYGERVRIHFDVNCPPLIRKAILDKKMYNQNPHYVPFYKRWKTIKHVWEDHGYAEEAAISDSPVFSLDFKHPQFAEIYSVLARLRARTKVSIEFASLPSVNVPICRREMYHRWTISGYGIIRSPTDPTVPIFRDFCAEIFPVKYQIVDNREIDINEERKFAITYLIECLISRGAVVKDQILLDEGQWSNFLEIIIHYYKIDDKLCEAALEDLIHMVDGRKRIGSILKCFDKICQKRQQMNLVNGLTENEIRDGFQRVRKIVFTPTRVIYIAPETIMGNRVLRRFDKDGTRVIRVTFRDDSNGRLRASTTGEELIDKTAMKFFSEGVKVANRDYGFLGCSNSQMRDNGAYFMEKSTFGQRQRLLKNNPNANLIGFQPKILEVRRHLGRFETIENVPKMMARLGQCFTQSRLTGVELERSDYCTTFDYEGAKTKPIVGKCYTYSDGVGIMSYGFAQRLARSMNFGISVPSCLQIRFRGMKGVIAIDPFYDEVSEWAQANGIQSYDVPNLDLKCQFRPSQIKFPAKSIPGDQIEMVKFSSPVLVALNKPFINILDQVSEMQSIECHRRVTGRIEELMDRQIVSFAKQMNDELYCRNKLKEFPRRIDIDFLKRMWGFTLCNEPFFRSLIKASIKFSITKQLRKEQIQIPKELGRSMLGIVDETGRLQYGQIFVQYTRNSNEKLPPRSNMQHMKVQGSQVVTGTVLLTKNPCIVTGDVRIFEAVDIPELHHLCDVVVFPQHGPRPHPDEMAGSDLDGDEYSVIWDQQLLLDKNEAPFDFTVEKKEMPYDREMIDQLMHEFYVKYLKLDSVGTISNNHLHNSDQYGLNSRVCMDLAKKNCQAVDFTKSGEPPAPLTKKWARDPETGEAVPPELAERVPDYHVGNDNAPVYVTPRLCGRLFREFQAIDDVIRISEEREEQYEIEIDESIKMEGYENYLTCAEKELANYNGQLRSIMETYGIQSEGEIMSGCILEMRNRISDKDQDDMSFFNTNQMIETRMTSLVCEFRKRFFEEFGGYLAVCTQLPNTFDANNSLTYRCEMPSELMMQKATAWYRACYKFAQKSRETRKLSFGWIAYDVLAKVKEHHLLKSEEVHINSSNPMLKFLEQHRKQYLIDNHEEFEAFRSMDQFVQDENSGKAIRIVTMYTTRLPGLDTVLFMLMKWGESLKLFEDQPFKRHHFFLLFILFLTRQLKSADGFTKESFFEKIDVNSEESDDSEEEDEQNVLTEERKSHLMIKFLEYLASRNFRKLPNLSFRSLDFSAIFMRGEWQPFHAAAIKTYYNILFTLRFEELPISTDPEITFQSMIRECDPYVIELPDLPDRLEDITAMMATNSGCDTVSMRRQSNKGKKEDKDDMTDGRIRYLVTARGTLENLQRLKKLVSVTIPLKSHLGGADVAKQMAYLCFRQIMVGFE